VCSLPRPHECLDVTPPPGQAAVVDESTWQRTLERSVADVVRQQAEAGVDIISDGEFGKSNWQGYIMERISGFEAQLVPPHKWGYVGRDLETFREFYEETRPELFQPRTRWVCKGPLEYHDGQITRD